MKLIDDLKNNYFRIFHFIKPIKALTPSKCLRTIIFLWFSYTQIEFFDFIVF